MAEGLIYKKIAQAMGDISAIGKNSRNQQQNFMYRGIDAVMNGINPALVKNGIFVVPEVLDQTREDRQTNKGNNIIYSICKMRFKFYAEDGSFVEAVTIGEGMDSGDKATNKAMSVAFKYACFQVFCIPTEEMVDPDAESHEIKNKDKPQQKKEDPKKEQPKERVITQQEYDTSQINKGLIDGNKINAIKENIKNAKVSEESVLQRYGITRFEDMTFEAWNKAMAILEKMMVKS